MFSSRKTIFPYLYFFLFVLPLLIIYFSKYILVLLIIFDISRKNNNFFSYFTLDIKYVLFKLLQTYQEGVIIFSIFTVYIKYLFSIF